jgi:hypothetical protein
MGPSRLSTAIRWIFAILLEIIAARLLIAGTHSETYLSAFGACLYGFAALIAGAVLLGPELILWAAAPIYRALNSLFFPSATGTPPVDYTLARFYRKRERYDEALEQYFQIVHYHPDELNA